MPPASARLARSTTQLKASLCIWDPPPAQLRPSRCDPLLTSPLLRPDRTPSVDFVQVPYGSCAVPTRDTRGGSPTARGQPDVGIEAALPGISGWGGRRL